MAGFLEEVLKNKEELVVKMLSVLQGQETSARVNLDGIEFEVSKGVKIKLNGQVEFTLVPPKRK